MNSPSQSALITALNTAVAALETKVGADGSAVTTSHDYKLAQLVAALNDSGNHRVFPRVVSFALGQGTPVTVGTNKTNLIVIARAGVIAKAFINAKTAPTGAALIVDVNLNGSTIWSTQGNRVRLADGATSGTQTAFNTTAVAEGDTLTIDVDQVGSSVAGQDVTVTLLILTQNS